MQGGGQEGALSQIPADAKPRFGWRELSTELTSCKTRFNSRLGAQTRLTPKCIQLKVTDVKVLFFVWFFFPPKSLTP